MTYLLCCFEFWFVLICEDDAASLPHGLFHLKNKAIPRFVFTNLFLFILGYFFSNFSLGLSSSVPLEVSSVPKFKMAERKKSTRKPRNPDWITWRNSEARCLLIEDLINSTLPIEESECPKELVWEIYKEEEAFANVPFDQFKARLRDHYKQVKKDLARSKFEENCLMQDQALFPCGLENFRGELIFDLHPAKDLLWYDIMEKLHVGLKPKDLWRTWAEYQEFELATFRGWIYQEICREKFINYLNMKREEKKELSRCKPPGTYVFHHPFKKQKMNDDCEQDQVDD